VVVSCVVMYCEHCQYSLCLLGDGQAELAWVLVFTPHVVYLLTLPLNFHLLMAAA